MLKLLDYPGRTFRGRRFRGKQAPCGGVNWYRAAGKAELYDEVSSTEVAANQGQVFWSCVAFEPL